MYTEDDKKVEVKNKNSNNYSDFYTSFNEQDDDSKKKKGKKKSIIKKEKVVEPKEEDDYSNFYGTQEEEVVVENKPDIHKWLKIGLIVLLVIALIAIIILLILKNRVKGDIELTSDNISLNVGESNYISYTIVDTSSEVTSTFTSSNETVAVVDENGRVVGLSNGESIITVKYTIDGKTREKTCTVKVTGEGSANQDLVLNLKYSNGGDNSWTNKDVIITVNANSIFGINSIKYAINCDGNCDYKTISNNSTIKVSNEGSTKVTVIALDKKNQETQKTVTVKIDKKAPKIEYSGEKNYTSNSEVEVCATCSDSLSGCRQSKVCKKYSETKANQVLTVYDNAGNKTNSTTFNVTINKVTQPCSLSVASDGTVTATLREAAEKYGFDSAFSGKNELSTKVTISASKAGESKAKIVYYYVKSSNGNVGKCYVTVIKECKCKDGTSGSNCTVSCTFRSN